MKPLDPVRNTFLDFTKGVLILLVAEGHAIQFAGYRGEGYWEDPVYKGIYLFHMPLFMAVSGYLTCFSVRRRSLWKMVVQRGQQLIVPVVAWSLLSVLVMRTMHPEAHQDSLLHEDIYEIIHSQWFLWSLFGATLIASGLRALRWDTPLAATITVLAALLLPEMANLHLFKYTLPYFWLGYFCGRRGQRLGQPFPIWACSRPFLGAMCLLSAAIYALWNQRSYVYTTGMVISWDNVPNILLRGTAGVAAGVVALAATWCLYRRWQPGWLIWLGANSFAIYLLQGYFFAVLEPWDHPWRNNRIFILLGAPLLALAVAFITAALGDWLSKLPWVGLLFFGKTGRTRAAPVPAPAAAGTGQGVTVTEDSPRP